METYQIKRPFLLYPVQHYMGRRIVFYNQHFETKESVIARLTLHYTELAKLRYSQFTDAYEVNDTVVNLLIHDVIEAVENTLIVPLDGDKIPKKYIGKLG